MKMLDHFKRPTDPPEFYHYYAAPVALLGAGARTSLASHAAFRQLSRARP
jgi:hypothetical protein